MSDTFDTNNRHGAEIIDLELNTKERMNKSPLHILYVYIGAICTNFEHIHFSSSHIPWIYVSRFQIAMHRLALLQSCIRLVLNTWLPLSIYLIVK